MRCSAHGLTIGADGLRKQVLAEVNAKISAAEKGGVQVKHLHAHATANLARVYALSAVTRLKQHSTTGVH